MLEKLKNLIALSPLLIGIAIGYLGHGIIKLILDMGMNLIHLLLKL